jgi:hypothetical protein
MWYIVPNEVGRLISVWTKYLCIFWGENVMKYSLIVCAFFIMLIAIPASAQIDPSTGLPFTDYESGIGPYDSGPILWDITHGVASGYDPSGRYSDLAGLLTSSGSSITVTDQGIQNIDLSQYCVLVISGGSAWDSPYTSGEAADIVAYVNQGGGLLVLADNPDTTVEANLSPVTQAFGTSVAVSYPLPQHLYFTNFAAHEIFAGVDEVYFPAAGELAGVTPSVEAAWTSNDEAMVTVVNPHSVVITGDFNFADNFYIVNVDNQTLILNIFDWLCTGTVGAEARSWGDLKAQFR